jgi:hypothetical protein
MPREEIFGKREEEETSSEGEGMRLAAEVVRSGVPVGRCKEEGMELEGRGMPRREIFGRSEVFSR